MKQWMTWKTPLFARIPKFETAFFLLEAPANIHLMEREKHAECDTVEWNAPASFLSEFHKGNIRLMPPQFYLLSKLEMASNVADLNGQLQSQVISPELLESSENGIKRTFLLLPGDCGHSQSRMDSLKRIHRIEVDNTDLVHIKKMTLFDL
jgi:hypothetical protein